MLNVRSKLASSDTSETRQGRERVLKQEVGPRALGVAAAAVWGGQGPPLRVTANFCQIVWFFSREAGNTDFFFF